MSFGFVTGSITYQTNTHIDIGEGGTGFGYTAAEFFGTITAHDTIRLFSQTSWNRPGGEVRDPGWEPC